MPWGGAGTGKLDAGSGMMALDLGQPGWVAGKADRSQWLGTALVQPPGLLGLVGVWEVVKLAQNVPNYLSVLLLGCTAVELTVPFN